MSIDLRQFHAAFYEESFEAIATMEAALLSLDAGTPDADAIHTIFRVAHSLKGGAATFGFTQISSFTHSLENLLDELRSGRMTVSGTLCELLLRAVDVLREMLRAQQRGQPIDAQRLADLQFDVELAVAQAPQAGQPAQPERLYRIHFRPLAQMLARGNDPLRMFRELRALGQLQLQADLSALPPLDALDAEQCHLAWTLQLRTGAPREAILEVFDWAESDCELHVQAVEAGVHGASPAAAGASTPGASTPGASTSGAPPAGAISAAAVPGGAAHGAAARAAAEALRSFDATSLRVSVEKIDDLMNSVGELVITQSMLGQLATPLAGAAGERLHAGLAQLERNVRELQESVMRVRMVPISFVFSRFPRMVRDLSGHLGKQVELAMSGEDTELDKTVLEKIGDPLVHLVRNSIDHGIETPADRRAAGKPEHGALRLHAYHRGSSITVEVSDDGAGLDAQRILAKARERDLIDARQPLGEQQIHELIFLPGFSTVQQASEVSGRGVGLDIVKRNVESLGGSVEVRSVAGRGALFRLTLPLTLAIIDGQTVAVGEESYIVPLTAIVESLQASGARLERVVGHGEVLAFRGEYLPLVRLESVFRTRCPQIRAASGGLIMVVEAEGRRIGLAVDELLGQQQVVVKTLETNYGHVEGIAGATILGNGAVALILDIAGLTRRVGEPLAA
ncbi:MAG TPA: chemotaxis protein CheA [Steroidobacteraceae bacterium]|nr:chemotaxis protein CheA [Steroidobacteraceae bacterium]